MSKSLEQFDRNPKGHYVLQKSRTSWGLPPGAQLYRAAKVAIAEGMSYDMYNKGSLPQEKRYIFNMYICLAWLSRDWCHLIERHQMWSSLDICYRENIKVCVKLSSCHQAHE